MFVFEIRNIIGGGLGEDRKMMFFVLNVVCVKFLKYFNLFSFSCVWIKLGRED